MTNTGRFARGFAAAMGAFGQIGRNELSLISAGVAFFAMLSIFPALAALIAILSLIADADVVLTQLEQVRGVLPDDVYRILYNQIEALVRTSPDTLGWTGAVSIGFALWSARAGVNAMMQGLNAVFDAERRPTLRRYLRALMLTLSLVALGIIALMTVVVAPVVLAFFPLVGVKSALVEALRLALALFVIFGGIGLLYRFGPNRRPALRQFLSPGAIFAAFSWIAVSYAFSYYVREFGNYNEVYGSIGAVIAMLIWLWMSSFVILLGASLNAELEARMPASAVVSDADHEPQGSQIDASGQL